MTKSLTKKTLIKVKPKIRKCEPRYNYLPINQRIGIVPERGMCSISPAQKFQDAIVCSNGTLGMLVYGDPVTEQIIFKHERLLVPRWKEGESPRAPKIGHLIEKVRELERDGKYREAANLSLEGAKLEEGHDKSIDTNAPHPAFTMVIEQPKQNNLSGYLRTLDFTTGEGTVHWDDAIGHWTRKYFVSKEDQVTVQQLSSPILGQLNIRIKLEPSRPLNGGLWEMETLTQGLRVIKEFTPECLRMSIRYHEAYGESGYVTVTRVVTKGGTAIIEHDELVVMNADSVLLLTKIERYPVIIETCTTLLEDELNQLEANYDSLYERHRSNHQKIMERCELKLSEGSEYLMSTEELLAEQHSKSSISKALMEKLFDMGRYYLLTDSGEIPPTYGHTNININLQVCSGNLTNLPESMHVFFNWIDSMWEQFRENAKNIFGMRGVLADVHPDAENGHLYHYDYNWPHHYWISAAGWIYNEYWGHYLVTGDKKFLEQRIIPGLKDIALFYEDFLTDLDEDGNYIFYPSYSPENWPENTGCMVAINAVMDIMVCREVLENLLEGLQVLGQSDEKIMVWQSILQKLPVYLLDEEGALKEWAWPGLEERYNHRHVSHHYDVWPGNAITWEETPELARAVLLSNRKRGQQDDSAHGIIHRAFTAVRLKDKEDAVINLKFILEHGFINKSLMTNHYPYQVYFPDALGAFPALFTEMLVYSRVGLIELLPALPRELPKGMITGICCFTFAKIEKLCWNLEDHKITLELLSLVEQELVIRYQLGFKKIMSESDIKDIDVSNTACRIQLKANEHICLTYELMDRV